VLQVELYDANAVAALEEDLHLPNLIARILSIRGIGTPDEARRFLYPRLEDLSDPFLLPDAAKGVAALSEAVRSGRKIGLYGDYDADGITSTALMVNFLQQAGVLPEVYIPGREEGYGLNSRAVTTLREKGVDLLLCLDCGSTNIEEIRQARESGMEVVVIDHHELGDSYPDTVALINPKRKDSLFPTRELAACGVVFFFLLALRRTMDRHGLLKHPINLKQELDLVSLGTVGDMVPLTGDNRILVKFGLQMMHQKPKRWLHSFFKKNMFSRQTLNQYALSFIIIPRINAAGRVSDPGVALRFLLAAGEKESETLLLALDQANRQRQGIEEEIVREAVARIEEEDLAGKKSIVLYKEGWPIGVIGIVAQKVAESYGKPCIIITRIDGTCRGSARGIDGIDLHGTVGTLAPLLIKFGGHKFACGLTLKKENLSAFTDAFEDAVNALSTPTRVIRIDAPLDFEQVTGDLVDYIELLAPFGVGNPTPGLLLAPASLSVNRRFVKLMDHRKRIWHGNLQRKVEVACRAETRIIACPGFRYDMGEKFIHFQIREFVNEA
jgi:single-stranded-DNA-specific exonuclease